MPRNTRRSAAPITGGADLLHAVIGSTRPGDAAKARMRELERELVSLKAEEAPAADPRVASALSEYARLLAEQRLGNRIVSAMAGGGR